MDWIGIIHETRILLTELQPDRFYALYALIVAWAIRHIRRRHAGNQPNDSIRTNLLKKLAKSDETQ